MKILKASAGSGKTYNLAKEYIRLLVKDGRPDSYRHILAVTFTNKATEEMKRRILKELHILAKEPEKSKYAGEFIREGVAPDMKTLQERAWKQLSGILHDYSAFAVSTIDRFFQQTLRAFSREIGQFSSYQVQLDREQLVSESVDRVLDSLSPEDGKTLGWLTEGVKRDLARTGKLSLESRLKDMAMSLRDLQEGEGDFSMDRLLEIDSRCKEIEESFPEKVEKAALAVKEALQAHGIKPEDSSRGWLTAIYKYIPAEGKILPPTDAFKRNAADSSKWFSKANDRFRLEMEGSLEGPLDAFLKIFETPLSEYNTALTIRSQIYGLGAAESLRQAFTAIQKEKNLLSIDDSNAILHGIIDGTDAPFIYEKLGVRFDDFLLDEFQDTADIQWDNFRPLVRESEAYGSTSLAVGDVKQSIYRWRGSDWSLLGGTLEKEFPKAEVKVLDGNWRTCKTIVEFNNGFFSYAAKELELEDIYADVEQKPMSAETAPGSVEVVFTAEQMEEITATLKELRERQAQWRDIAILVRSNSDGSAIAAELVRQGIPVVSDDSLFVKASATVRRLVAEISLAVNPRPEEETDSVAAFLAGSLQIDVPEGFHSLTDLAETLLRGLKEADPDSFNAEIPYIISFMDYLQEWVGNNGNNPASFLSAWEAAEPKIASPGSGNAVRIMTVHKSKGLEFPYVIFPFADKVSLYKASACWCSPQLEGTSLEGKAEGLYRVSLDSNAANSLFRDRYLTEKQLQAVDNINIFYVAMTRAKYGLKVISAKPDKNSFSKLLLAYVGTERFSAGEPFPGTMVPREESPTGSIPSAYPSFETEGRGRLCFSPEAADYFGGDGSFGADASARTRGSVLHDILSRVEVPEDLDRAVDSSVMDGSLKASDRDSTIEFLRSRIESAQGRGWFAKGCKVLRETSITDSDGNEYRPDRVVISPEGKVTVIDYKFGAEESRYAKQVNRYADLFRRMGYADVEGYLWYLGENKVQSTLSR